MSFPNRTAAAMTHADLSCRMLFRHQDLSQIKDFCRQEWTKILTGRVSVQDFIIAKEVRLGSYSYVVSACAGPSKGAPC